MSSIILPQVDKISSINYSTGNLLVESDGKIHRLKVNNFTNNKLDSIEENANNFSLTDNCIKNSHLSDDAVTADKIAEGAVTTDEIADGSITLNKLNTDIKDAMAAAAQSVEFYKGILYADKWVSETGTSDFYKNMENKWKWEKFASVTMADTIRATLASSTPTALEYIDDAITSISMNKADSYTARCTTYIYALRDIDFPCTCSTDDAGRMFVNGVQVASIASCAVVDVTLPLKKGANCIEVFYTEGSGGDGWEVVPHLPERIGYELYAMSAEPAVTWSQTITPECLSGSTSKLNANTILSPAIMYTEDYSDAEYRNRINSGYITHDDAGTITVHYLNTVPIDKDLEVYWFGKTLQFN